MIKTEIFPHESMHNGNLAAKILENFPHQATPEQLQVVHLWEDFLLSRDADRIFVLKGYAGTGKTSLIAALVKTWTSLQQRVALLAPTGRAAKVMSDYSGLPAFTIHKFIYRRKSFGDDEHFTAMPNLVPGTLFLVDEAHNLPSRARSMYSASVCDKDLKELKNMIKAL